MKNITINIKTGKFIQFFRLVLLIGIRPKNSVCYKESKTSELSDEMQLKTNYYEEKIEIMNRINVTDYNSIRELEQQVKTLTEALEAIEVRSSNEPVIKGLARTALKNINK